MNSLTDGTEHRSLSNTQRMEESTRRLQVSRHPRKVGSGRQTIRRSFTLTVRLGDALTFSRQRETRETSVDGCAPFLTSSAAGVVCPKGSVMVCSEHRESPQPNVCGQVPSELVPNIRVENNLDMAGSLGYHHRVKVTAVRRTGSGRSTTPRAFQLHVELPEIRRTVLPSSLVPTESPEPSETPAFQQQQQADLGGPQHGVTVVESGPGELHPSPLELPSIHELVKLAFEMASSKEEKAHDVKAPAMASPVLQKSCEVAMEVERVSSMPLTVTAQPSTASPAKSNTLQSTQTPATGRAVNILSRAESLQRHAWTPEEGMPESLYWSGPLSNNAISDWHQRAALGSKPPETCSTSNCSMSPLEGIPEKPIKRQRRVSVLPQAQWSQAAVHNGPHLDVSECKEGLARTPDPTPSSHEPSWEDLLAGLPPVVGERSPQDGGVPAAEARADMPPCLDELNAAVADVGAAIPAVVQRLLKKPVCSMTSDELAVISASPYGVSPRSHIPTSTGKDRAHENSPASSSMLGNTVREDLAAATFSAATLAIQAELQRFKAASCYATMPDMPDAAALTRSVSCPSTSTLVEPSTASSHGTPLVVKIQYLREAIDGAMKRIAENLGGMPSCHTTHSLPRSGLPPRPPSTSSLVATVDGASLPDTAERNIIRRAPSGTFLFPSRTPSPICSLKKPSSPLGQPGQPFALGRVSGAGTVTPPPHVTCQPITGGNDTIATATTATTRVTAHVNTGRRDAAVGPMVVETGTSPFTDGDLRYTEAAPDKSAAFASPFSADASSDINTEDSERHPTESLASLSEFSPVLCGRESTEHAQGTNAVEGCTDTIKQRDRGDPGPSDRQDSGLHADVAKQTSSESAGPSTEEDPEDMRSDVADERSEDNQEPGGSQNMEIRGRDESEERSRVDSPQYRGSDSEPGGTRGFREPPGKIHPSNCQQHTPGRQARRPASDEPDLAKMLASALRQEYGYKMNHDRDNDDLAIEEVMALAHPADETDTPIPARWDKAEAVYKINRPHTRSQSAGAQTSRQTTATAVVGVTAPSAAGPAAAISGPPAGGPSKAAAQPPESGLRLQYKVSNRKSLARSDLGLAVGENGTRRSTRSRVRPLEYWRGEGKSYGRDHKTMPTVRSIMVRTPEPQWPLPSGKVGKGKRFARIKHPEAAATAADNH